MTISTRISEKLTEGPSFLERWFVEREGAIITMGVVNKKGRDYAWTTMDKIKFAKMIEQLMEGP